MDNKPFEAELIREIDLTPYGGITEVFPFRAKNGDNQILWVATKGIFMSNIYLKMTRGMYSKGLRNIISQLMRLSPVCLPYFHPYHALAKEDRNLFFMALTDASGRCLWQFGTPSANFFYCSHQGEHTVALDDINCDGRDEILTFIRPGNLAVISSDSGGLLCHKELPQDNFSLIKIVNTDRGKRILVGVTEAAYYPHHYGNPLLILDSSLNILNTIDLPYGIGHSVLIFDANNDGYEEILAGYSLLDGNGSVLWTADSYQSCSSYLIAAKMHADCGVIITLPYRDWKAAIAGSDRLLLLNSDGKIEWERPAIHSQYILAGQLTTDHTGPLLFHIQCRHKMELLDLKSNLLWEGKLPANWPYGRPKQVPNDDCFHMGRPASIWHNPLKNGVDLIVYNEAGWPYAIDGYGRIQVTFPYPSSLKKSIHSFKVPAGLGPDDFGYGYKAYAIDLDGDQAEEILIFDRINAWIYKIKERSDAGQ